MLENTSIYSITSTEYIFIRWQLAEWLAGGKVVLKVLVNISFSQKRFLFNIKTETKKVFICGSKCALSIRVYVWASENAWVHIWGKPCLCEFVRCIFQEKASISFSRLPLIMSLTLSPRRPSCFTQSLLILTLSLYFFLPSSHLPSFWSLFLICLPLLLLLKLTRMYYQRILEEAWTSQNAWVKGLVRHFQTCSRDDSDVCLLWS